MWHTFSEARLDDDTRQQLVDEYQSDHKYMTIVEELKKLGVREDAEDSFRRPGYAFEVVKGRLYNITANGSRRLCIPHSAIKDVLAMAHDEKHHFGRDRMFRDLEGLAIHQKTNKVKNYLKYYSACKLDSTDRQPPIGDYRPVRPEESAPMSIIAMDFIVRLPRVKAENPPWKLEGFGEYDSMLTVTCRSTKRTMLLPGHSTYAAAD